jgi:hypothetical protein
MVVSFELNAGGPVLVLDIALRSCITRLVLRGEPEVVAARGPSAAGDLPGVVVEKRVTGVAG